MEEAPSALRPGSQINRETAEMKKTNPLYVLAWYVPPILLIPALFMFLVRVDASERFLDFLILLLVLLIVAIPLCVPILMKKRMEKRAAVLEKDFPNINYKFTSHNCVLYLDTEGGHVGAVSYTHLRAHETGRNLVCRLLLEKKKNNEPENSGRNS